MAKKCTPNDPLLRDASVEATNIALSIEASYNREFGMPMNTLPILKVNLKNLSKELQDAQLQLNFAIKKKDHSASIRLKKEVVKLKKDIIYKRTAIKEAPQKFKVLTAIRNLLTDNINDWADRKAYQINPDIYFPLIADFLKERYGFVHSMDRSLGGIRQIHKRLTKILATQKLRDDEPISTIKRQMQDPGILMLKQDPTGLAFDLVNKSREAPAEIFGIANKYNNLVKNSVSNLRIWLSSNKYLFRTNIPTHGEIDSDALEESFEKMVSFAFDAMDGRVKYIKAMPIGAGKEENAAFKADEEEYNKIVKRNIFDEINEGGEIQKLTTPQGQTFYYVVIKQETDKHDGKEVYYAYQVPHKPGKVKEGVPSKDFLLLPRSTKKGPKGEAARQDYDQALGGDARLATYTSETGQAITGRMGEGWYESKTYVPLEGVKKEIKYGMLVKRKFNVYSYSSYQYNDNLNTTDDPGSEGDVPPVFWDFISELRVILKDFHTYATDKNRTTENVRKEIVNTLTKLGAKKMATEEFDELINQVLNIDGLRSNMALNNKGDLVTSNTFFGEIYNYIMWRYTPSDLIRGNVLARNALVAKVKELGRAIGIESARETSEMTAAEVLDNTSNITANKLDLEELEGLIQHFDDLIDIATGKKTFQDTERLNQVQMIAAAQHRKGFINPFPTYNEDGTKATEGRLAYIEVFGDYFYDTARGLVHNDLRNDLLNVLGETSAPVSEFMLDHIKATFGMMDVNAGVFGFDYSNPKVAKKLTKFFKKFRGPDYVLTDEDVHTMSRMHSMFISGNLLQLGSTLNNHFQRISVWIESVDHDWQEADRLRKAINPRTGRNYADEISEASGSTEVSIGLADSLIGMMSDEVTMGTGWFAKQDLAVLSLSKKESLKRMRNSKAWESFFSALIERRTGGNKATATQLKNIYKGTWELINGIEEGTLTKEQIKGIQQNLEGVLAAELINKYASWGLKGGYAAGLFEKIDVAGKLTFSGVESEMRRWTAVQFAVMAVNMGMVPSEVVKDPAAFGLSSAYVHPNALKMARIGNNVTMFGLSPQFLPQMFRGGVGALLFKFKPYQWHQGRREMLTILNYWDSLSGASKTEMIWETLLLAVPPYLGIEKATSVFGLSATKRLGKKQVSEPHEKLRKFLWSRALFALIFTPSFYMPGLTFVRKLTRREFRGSAYGVGQKAIERGGVSVIGESVLALIGVMGLISGFINPEDEEGEEEIYQEASRWYLPLYFNLAIEAAQGRPMNAVRAYSQSAYRVGRWGRDIFDSALGLEED